MNFELELDKLWVKLQAQTLDPKLVKLKPNPKSSKKPYCACQETGSEFWSN
jgi:hypothetical protein